VQTAYINLSIIHVCHIFGDGEGMEMTDMVMEMTTAQMRWAPGEALWDGDKFLDVGWGMGDLLFPCYSLVD